MQKKKKPFRFPKNIKQFDIIEIIWEDHCSASGWESVKHALESPVYVAKTVGYYLGIGKDNQIVTASTKGMGESTNSQSYLLLSDVRSVRKIA